MPELSSHGTVSSMRCVLQRPKGVRPSPQAQTGNTPVFAGTNTTAPPVIRDVISTGIEARGRGRGGSTLLVRRSTRAAGSGDQTTLCRPLKSTSHSPVGKPVAIVVGNRQVLPAPVANWLHRRSDAMADDLVDRLAGGAEIEKIVHCTYRVR